MSKFLQRFVVVLMSLMTSMTVMTYAQQVTNANFEDWSGTAFDGEPQPKGWNASHVEQVGMKFNFAHKETGHNGGYCLMVQDQDVGAMGITETSPGYFSLGQPWQYLPSITAINQATAGTYGGVTWSYRPDTLSVWIRRTGTNWSKEDFYLLYYAWSGTAKSNKYKGKNGSCTSYEATNEESDIRLALNGNECGTQQKATQVAEGMWRERKEYGNWTNIRVPIYYMNNTAPTMMNLIFSASNYPNFRANDGLYTGNSLYVDDVEFIYSAAIQKLYVDGKAWNGFDPKSSEIQYYPLGETATAVPTIEAMRGAGSLTNAHGTTVNFPGRTLSGSEITITYGDLSNKPTTIVVKSGDGKTTKTYKIQFQKAASSNTKLAGIRYVYKDKKGVEVIESVPDFNPTKTSYTVELPYGTTAIPVLVDTLIDKQEDKQTIALTQASSVTGTASILVTAPNGKDKATYSLKFAIAKLADNTLKGITINGKDLPGFTPGQTTYKVSLPVGTTKVPEIKAISEYPAGEQTIEYVLPTAENLNGGTALIKVTTPGNPTARTYKLTFKLEASTYSYLKDLKAGDYIKNFEPEKFTYYVNLPLGTTSLPTITAVKGDEYQSEPEIALLPEGVTDGTVRITATAANGDQTVYKIVFSTEKSDNSSLKAIQVNGQNIPGFNPDITAYVYALPVGTTEMPVITWTPGDEYQTITLTTGGLNGKSRLMVTAGDGSTTIYQISFSVQTYSVNTLKALYVGGALIEGFDEEKEEYWINMPQGTTERPAVTYELQNDELQSAAIRDFKGLNGDYKITVRPQSGASRTYVIHFAVETSSNVKLKMLYIDGKPVKGFDPEVLNYVDSLPEGVSIIPPVTFEKDEDNQKVLSILENRVQTITVTAQSGAKREYTITFIVSVSKNAFLENIYVDGKALEGFDKEKLDYTYFMTTERCPEITVDKAPGQQVTITAPYGAGTATIKVKPEEGEANTYTIKMEPVAAATVRLKGILINGSGITTFEPTTMSYEATYTKDLPTIGFIKDNDEQKVQVLWKENVAWLHVSDNEGNKAAYNVTFTQVAMSVKTLEAIYANGQQIAGFDPSKTNYNFELPAGSTYPEIGYKAADNTEILFFGQLEDGKWGITAMAEDGTKATYTVTYTILPYSDVTLANLAVKDYQLVYDAQKTEYGPFVIDEGVALPQVTAEPNEGQSIYIFNENDSTQRVQVMAESGATNVYTIHYSRVKSDDINLKDLLVNGVQIPGFSPEKRNYTYDLTQGATVVPSINAIPELDNQTVTTYFSRPNGVTKIVVKAQNGAEGEYTIAFPVEKSDNTLLKKLVINNETKDVNVTEYEFNVGFGTVDPYDVMYETYDGQMVRFVDAPITGETKIIVTNEKGNNSRTYSIRYVMAQPQGENKVKKVSYSYVNAEDVIVQGELEPTIGENIVNIPFGSKSFTVTNVEQNYTEQSIMFYNGGIRRGAKIIAVANRSGEDDVEYTIVPVMPEFETNGKLKSLNFNGQPVPNWRPDVYNYMVNVTAQPTASDFTYEAYDGKSVTVTALDNIKKQVIFKVAGGEEYSVCWYYMNDGKYQKNGNFYDYLDFSQEWEPTKTVPLWKSSWTSSAAASSTTKSTGFKPTGWIVPADIVAGLEYDISIFGSHVVDLFWWTGKEVIAAGSNGAMLSTINGASINGSMPGMMTLGGTMKITPGKSGSSSSSITYTTSNFVTMRNTPDSLSMRYKSLAAQLVTGWYYELRTVVGNTTRTDKFNGNYNTSSWRYASWPITAYNGAMSKYALTINSCTTENAGNMSGSDNIYTSDLQIENVHFVYNSELKAATVNGKGTEKIGNTFTYTLGENEVILGHPALKFTKVMHDQMQVIEWGKEWENGVLTATVTNYGENSQDNTVYYVKLVRTPVKTVNYTAEFGNYPTTKTKDTLYINLPYGTKIMPSLTITPDNVHQLVTMTKKANAVTVKVMAEDGADSTMVYVFREVKTSDALLESWNLESGVLETVDAENLIYAVTLATTPKVEYTKKEGQTVDVNYTINGITMTVTAADEKAQKTYTIQRKDPVVTTTGQIKEFTLGNDPWSALDRDTYTANGPKPEGLITFERMDYIDSVVYIQAPTKQEWQVYGTVNHTYTYTYPTAKSNNALLADILIGGKSYSEYSDQDFTYPIESDTMLILEVLGAEPTQKIVTTQSKSGDQVVQYNTTVTAEDETTTNSYTIAVVRPKDTNATLEGIMLDSVMISNFDPNTFDYEVVLPSPAVKKAQPKMPNIAYIARAGQKVTLKTGALNDVATEILVMSEAGNDNTYTVTVKSAPSTCVDLTGITVNGATVDLFEPGRHYYSQSMKTSNVEIDYTSDDRFQDVTIVKETILEEHEYRFTLYVKAEDGVSEAQYEVMIYVENPSNDAQLANITLDGKNFDDFERLLNEDLVFDGGNNNYEINLPSGTTILPEVSAQLKMDGQSVEITQKKDSILLDVTATDGTKNQYVLKFVVPLSKNADLSMIFLDGEELPNFEPNYYFYQVDLPVGVHTMPEVAAQKGENSQKIQSVEMDADKFQASIKVQAEDPKTRENIYVVVFHTTQSDADKLDMIYQDGQPLEGFRPDSMYYTKSLPVGTIAFPDLAWQEADDYQTIHMDTVESSLSTLVRQIIVAAESGKKSTYTVSYTIEKSAIDTLQAIFIAQKQLTDFNANKEEYRYTLSASEASELNGMLPSVDYIAGDEYQTVLVSQALDSLESKSLGYKSLLTVTAASGKTRTYTIHYPVEKSNDASLLMIMLSGKPIVGFDAERLAYRLEVDFGADLPLVSVVKKEEVQVYDIRFSGDSIYVDVTAESGYQQTYSLLFERRMSSNADLKDLLIAGHEDMRFRSDEYDYMVRLPYGEDTIPAITWELQDSLQTVPEGIQLDTLENGSIVAQLTVVAPNGEDESNYIITFQLEKNNDNSLLALYVDTTLVDGFDGRITEYTYLHPFGSDSTVFFGLDRVHYELSDSLAADTMYIDANGTIYIMVTAQNGKENIYTLTQKIAFDSDNALSAILIAGDTIRGFDPEILGYTYYVREGEVPPELIAIARSENAEDPIWREVQAGDTCFITVIAQDQSQRKYYVHFAISQIDDAATPTSSDVLIKHIPGTMQIFVATIRKDVQFALFDQNGTPFFYSPIPITPADPNDAEVITDTYDQDRLNDIYNTRSGLLIDVMPGQIYMYGFYQSGKRIISSGKFKINP